jgi:hypothetical protein
MPNLISAFKDLDCSTNVYWGTSAGRSHYFKEYFRGLAYAMSWPLVRLPHGVKQYTSTVESAC